MDLQKNRGMIILIIALILAVILTFYVGVVNPIILGLGILAIIVILINIYVEKIRKKIFKKREDFKKIRKKEYLRFLFNVTWLDPLFFTLYQGLNCIYNAMWIPANNCIRFFNYFFHNIFHTK